MARYIDADEAYEIGRQEHKDFAMSMGDLTSLREVLDDTPTADVVERRHGWWIYYDNGTFVCSECGKRSGYKKYCGDCGAIMDKAEQPPKKQTIIRNKYPCERGEGCAIKKAYAKRWDIHWHDHEDCPVVCPHVKEERSNENGT